MAARGFHIADAYVSIYADKDPLKRDIEGLGNDPGLGTSAETSGKGLGKRTGKGISAGVDAKKIAKQAAKDFGDGGAADFGNAGKDSGNKLSQGFKLSIVRNSPVWAAAIGGALSAGAPAVTAAGSLLFIGVAAALASQALNVKTAWDTLGADIVSGATSDAASLNGVFVHVAQSIGATFQTLRPQFRDIFSSLGPQIEVLTQGLLGFVTNAMPGLVSMVTRAGPVMSGFATMFERVGTGLSRMFDTISQHAPAGGVVLAQIGQVIQNILPIIGQLVGQGAELASRVLPLLSGSLGIVLHVLNAIAPILPVVGAGFLAFRTVSMLSGPLNSLSGSLAKTAQNLAFASYNGGAFAGTAGKLSEKVGAAGNAVSKVGSALPVVGAVVAFVGTAMEMASQQTDDWAQALMAGGNAADQATLQMQKVHDALTTGFSGFLASATGATTWANALGVGTNAADTTKAKIKELEASMSPLQLQQQKVTQATNEYSAAVAKYGPNSDQAQAAAGRLASANGVLKQMQDGVNTAMQGGATAAQNDKEALQGIADKAGAANTQIALLKGSLDALTGAAVTADQAQIQITQAVAAATTATQGQTGALLDTNNELDLHSQKGAAAASALINLASTMHNAIATDEQLGKSQADVSAKSDQLRAQFYQTALQMTGNAGAAQNLTDRYFGIPEDIHTNIAAYDNASPVISHVQQMIAGLHDKNIFLTTYERVVSTGPAGLGGSAYAQAMGGVIHAFSGGGFETMSGGMATIVPPKSLRLIGDRVVDDEAYIPINKDVSSQQTLRQTSRRMGYDLTPVGQAQSGARTITIENLTVQINGTLDLTNPAALRTLAVQIRDAIIKVEREAK